MSSLYTNIVSGATAIDTVASAAGHHLVRPSYSHGDSGGVTMDTANCHIKLAGYSSTAVAGAITVTGNNCSLEVGPGWTINNIVLSGASRFILLLHNGCSVGNITSSGSPDYLLVKGSGWGAQLKSVDYAGSYGLFDGFAIDASAEAAGTDAVQISGGSGFCTLKFLRIIDAIDSGIVLSDPRNIVYGCVIADATDHAIDVSDPLQRILNNVIMTTSEEPLRMRANADDCVIDGNYLGGTKVVQFVSGADDNIFVRNRSIAGGAVNSGTNNTFVDNFMLPTNIADIGDLALHLDSSMDINLTYDGSNRISQWNDESGEANHATQSGGDNLKPVRVASGLNGLTIVRFDGSDDYMSLANASNFNIANGDGLTVFMVAKFGTYQTSDILRNKNTGAAGAHEGFSIQMSSSGIHSSLIADNSGTDYNQISSSGPPSFVLGSWVIYNWIWVDGTWKTFHNNGDVSNSTTVVGTVNAVAPGNTCYLGAAPNDQTRNPHMDIAEVIVFVDNLSWDDTSSMSDKTRVYHMLKNKWGL